MFSLMRSAHWPLIGGGLLGLGVFAISLLGILSRPHFDLATFWPANAFMLGMMIRFPVLRRPATWLCCAAGFFLADGLTGSTLLANAVLNTSNLVTVLAGYLLLSPVSREDQTLSGTRSVLLMLRAIFGASIVAGLVGAFANPLLFGRPPLEGFLFWGVSEMMNFAAFLPMLLTIPRFRRPDMRGLARRLGGLDAGRFMPLLALVLSCLAGALVGGPGALAFPVPALLWCALSYNLFVTSCLAFAFGAWTLVALRTGLLSLGVDMDSRDLVVSTRVGVTLMALAPIVVGSVMAARLELLERLRVLADRDAMTGLRNRRAFFEAGKTAFEGPEAGRVPVAVMMADIDHFKAINDAHGHESGDRVLIAFGRLLEQNVRPQDTVGRIGGEEFGVILHGCGPDEAAAVAVRIAVALRNAPVLLADGRSVRPTVSIGIHVERQRRPFTGVLADADAAMYAAKHAGRDRFALSPTSKRTPSPSAGPCAATRLGLAGPPASPARG